jgi:Costars
VYSYTYGVYQLRRASQVCLIQPCPLRMPTLPCTIVIQAAKRKGVIDFEGQILLRGAHDNVIIKLR